MTLLNKYEFVGIQQDAAEVRQAVLPDVLTESGGFVCIGRTSPGKFTGAAHRVGASAKTCRKVFALPNEKVIVEHCQRLQWRHRNVANRRQLGGVGAVQRIHEGVRQGTKDETVDAAAAVCGRIDVELRVID